MRNPKEIENIEYNEFYKNTFNEFLDPLAHTLFTTEVFEFIKQLCEILKSTHIV
jgi:HSP90 family molecular chaperone